MFAMRLHPADPVQRVHVWLERDLVTFELLSLEEKRLSGSLAREGLEDVIREPRLVRHGFGVSVAFDRRRWAYVVAFDDALGEETVLMRANALEEALAA